MMKSSRRVWVATNGRRDNTSHQRSQSKPGAEVRGGVEGRRTFTPRNLPSARTAALRPLLASKSPASATKPLRATVESECSSTMAPGWMGAVGSDIALFSSFCEQSFVPNILSLPFDF
jgi:hypothetical protein